MQQLDTLRFPLKGRALIEASAGTGKTFTIAALYLRLVLGARDANDDTAFDLTGLMPPQILVVTFTEAATLELRDRIRARLTEGVRVFRDSRPVSTISLAENPDTYLYALRNGFPPERWPQLAWRLDMAAQWMDEAAIYTIHGFCQKMIRSHAFDSRSLFDLTVNTAEKTLRDEAVRDYWRKFIYPLNESQLSPVLAVANTPDALGKRVLGNMRYRDEIPVPVADTLADIISKIVKARSDALNALKGEWLDGRIEKLADYLEQIVADKLVKAQSLNKPNRTNWIGHLQTWAQGDADRPKESAAQTRLTESGLDEIRTGSTPLPFCPVLQQHEYLHQQLNGLPDPTEAILVHAIHWIANRIDAEKLRRAEIGFDDMITRLSKALNHEGQDGALANTLRQQFPVAMIDEFQDTDLAQFTIFDQVYPQWPHNKDATGFFMIGDPKQAIYGFRGGDIYTYLAARRDLTENQRYTLGTNFRSTVAMVKAVNHLFNHANTALRDQGGAFCHPDIPFLEVNAQGRPETLQISGLAQAAVTLIEQADAGGPKPGVDRKTYLTGQAAASAARIADLLFKGQTGTACFSSAKGNIPVCPRDIAVLVRDRHEARAIRDELALRGIRSVYLSDKDSVFASQEAFDILSWLCAVAAPEDGSRVRAALACPTLGWPLADLDRLVQDELFWEDQLVRFMAYRQIWRTQGVLALILQIIEDENLAGRLLQQQDQGGERSLTNLLHLAEVLQAAESETDGEQGLIRYLSELTQGDEAASTAVLRLESEAELVRVVTLHKSKGLEYPLVFIPFACAWKKLDARRVNSLRWHDNQEISHLDLTATNAAGLIACEADRLAEDIRLIYVGLTRACHALWLGVAPLRLGQERECGIHQSGLGYLLGGGQPIAVTTLPSLLAGFAQSAPDLIRIEALGGPDWHPSDTSKPKTPLHPARSFTGKIPRDWWVVSYTSLISHIHADGIAQATREHMDEAAHPLPDLDTEIRPDAQQLHNFNQGPQAGVFLHGLFEWAAEQGFARAASDADSVKAMLGKRCNRRSLEGWIERLADWLPQTLKLPLRLPGGGALALTDLDKRHAKPELEFWMQVDHVDFRKLDRLVSEGIWPGLARPALDASTANGMLKGFIDLTFEHKGQFYVLDYKSNRLGGDVSAYSPATMQTQMLNHRYDLQAVLYCLALHRQLKARLGSTYRYDQHLGGFLYLFLRGLDDKGGGQVAMKPPQTLIEAIDQLFRGTEKEVTAHA